MDSYTLEQWNDFKENLEGGRNQFDKLAKRVAITPIDGIIIDDCSGRIPGLFVRRLLSLKAKDTGTPMVPTVCWGVGRSHITPKIREDMITYTRKSFADNTDNIAIVTELVATGDTMHKLQTIAREAGLSTVPMDLHYSTLYGRYSGIGVRKSTKNMGLSRWHTERQPRESWGFNPEVINATRKWVDEYATYLYNKYFVEWTYIPVPELSQTESFWVPADEGLENLYDPNRWERSYV